MGRFAENLVKARSHLVFIAALAVATVMIVKLDAIGVDKNKMATQSSENVVLERLRGEVRLPFRGIVDLRPDQIEWAKIAWRYFDNNIDPITGLAGSVANYHSTTMWDTGSFLFALLSAKRLGLIEPSRYRSMVVRAASSLSRIELFQNKLPNKAYNTSSLEMVDYNNNKSSGIGYSALDIARLLVALLAIETDDPSLATSTRPVYQRWSIGDLVSEGDITGVVSDGGEFVRKQEGRIGYEQYAARSVASLLYDTSAALNLIEHLDFKMIEGIAVPIDDRDSKHFGALDYTMTEPFVMMVLEMGPSSNMEIMLQQVYRAQEERYRARGILTAVSEGHLNKLPSFAYSTVYGEGEPWAVLDPAGNRIDNLRFVSTKIAFAFNLLFETEYSDKLLRSVLPLNDPKGGWLEGRYEDGSINDVQTANTNALILESLSFRRSGPLALPVK